ncbi:cytochrome-c peroxidase [Ulvibacter litoralis]|uniref:Cytochrome c peroxidase n=1 Tax=Ulvibacter litoralis TaxID=227084 RepID=A0A1G7EX35_9FLAO|nr:cytochrome c peroxidase [Ulvibacter litoralis]SDE68208.1 cytochrome c peroxidase [Ulvibacter litoralis]
MNRIKTYSICFVGIFICCGFAVIQHKEVLFDYPEYWPKPAYDFSKLSMTEEEFQLGRHLFYDPILSRDNTISCASCHLQATGFTHVDHDLSHGIDGNIGTRNSMTLMNLAWSTSFMWDGGVNHIEVQALAPITSEDEMDNSLEAIVEKLNASEKYKTLFYRVHNDSVVTGQKTLLALTQFVVMLNSYNSKYDKYIRNEAGGEFTAQEKNGLELFRTNCASCHKEPLFTSQDFKNIGLAVDTTLNDFGRMGITANKSDSLKFKVPTLRNIQFTSPYMHDGRFETLQEVLQHYTTGIQQSNTLAPELKNDILLTPNERVDLLVFLRTLSDTDFLFNKRFNYPNNY